METETPPQQGDYNGVEIATRPTTLGRFQLDAEARGATDDTLIQSIELPLESTGEFMVIVKPQEDGTSKRRIHPTA